jgi:hypothetical protein
VSKINVDSSKLKDTGKEIVTLGLEYTEIINTIFDRINAYSKSDIWVGPSAENYISLVNTEKSQYDFADDYENSISSL